MRLTLKELREILRDRRTILTLVLMPLFMYPLMSVAFQQFFVSQLSTIKTPHYKLGFENERDAPYLTHMLHGAGLALTKGGDGKPAPQSGTSPPLVEAFVCESFRKGLEDYDIHLGLRLVKIGPAHDDPRQDLAVNIELWHREDWISSRDALAYVEKYVSGANQGFLDARLKILGVTQRAAPLRVIRKIVKSEDSASGAISITAVIPFILILMTVTGAVYPAIDLTAGERERGTLEVLVAAPIPRIGVLLAKYVAVLTVALLTAAANLLAMTITLAVSGLGRQLFGEQVIPAGVIAAVFGLLLLFAAFFSAVLLAITSSARSFKEAQAYLIPLMLVSLAPGMLGLMPGIELSGLWLVTPLANIVLLGRDLFALKVGGAATLVVVVSTLLYAAAAIAVAARIFGAESVLYSSQSGWADLFRRPRQPQTSPTITAAFLCLAVMFPAYFVFLNLLGRMGDDIVTQLLLGVLMTAAVLGAIPLAACQARRVPIGPAFRIPDLAAGVFAAATVLGLSFWVISHEAVLAMQRFRDVSLDPIFVKHVSEYADHLRALPVFFVFLAMALTPAVFEEAFFRGYLFSALRSRASAAATIVTTAIVFGAFHLIAPNPLASERFVSSTLVGLALGWLRWRTGTLLPGILMHTCHNGLLILLVYFEPQLSAHGIGIARETHLPAAWLAAGVTAACAGLCVLYALTCRRPAEPATYVALFGSFPGSAWERDASEALPRSPVALASQSGVNGITNRGARQSLAGSAVPGRAWDRGSLTAELQHDGFTFCLSFFGGLCESFRSSPAVSSSRSRRPSRMAKFVSPESDATTQSAGGDEAVRARSRLRQSVLTLAIPALGEQLLNFCVSLFDTYLAGQVSSPSHEVGIYTTTVGIAGYISWLATLIFSLVGTGTTALVSRARGAGDLDQANRFANRSLTLAGGLGLVVFVILTVLAPLYAQMQQMQGESYRVAVGFLRTDAFGQVFFCYCLIGSAALRSMGDMRTPMIVLGVVNILNIVLSSSLVFGLGPIEPMGIDGIVTGTVTARICGGLLMLGVLGRGVSGLKLHFGYLVPHSDDIRRILKIGVPAAVDGILMWCGQWLFLMIISRLGDGSQEKAFTAAHMIGMEAEALTYLPATAWGYAAASLVGQSLGAGDPLRARRLGNEAARQCIIVAIVGALVYLLGAQWIYAIMTQEAAVREIGVPALRFLSWYQIPLAVMVVYIYAIRGAGDTRAVMFINIFGIMCIRLPVGYLLGIVCSGGLIGAWSGMCLDVVFRTIASMLYYRRGRWAQTKV